MTIIQFVAGTMMAVVILLFVVPALVLATVAAMGGAARLVVVMNKPIYVLPPPRTVREWWITGLLQVVGVMGALAAFGSAVSFVHRMT